MGDLPKTSGLLSDREAERDLLDFSPYTETLLDIVRDPQTLGPLVVGLFGAWGSGKTSLMRFVERALRVEKTAKEEPAFRVVWFDAWKYEKEEALWRALLLRVVDELRLRDAEGSEVTPKELKKEIERLEQRLYQEVEWEEKGNLTIDWPKAAKATGAAALKLSFSFLPGFATQAVEAAQKAIGEGKDAENLFDAFQREVIQHRQAQLRSIEQFQIEFGNLIDQHILKNGQRLVVFVDDLDRCLPEKAIQVLEAIKLFLDVRGCIFVLGLDQSVVTQGIKVKYREFLVDEKDADRIIPIDGANYLEKIIQLPFRLPKIEPRDMKPFVSALADFADDRCADVFAEGLETNPRKVKRAINIFLFISKLAQKRKIEIRDVRLAKIVVIYHSHPPLYDQLRLNPSLLRDLENYYRAQSEITPPRRTDDDEVARLTWEKQEIIRQQPPVDAPLLTPSLKSVLTLFLDAPDACFSEIGYDELNSYFTLTRGAIVETPVAVAQSVTTTALSFPAPTFIRIPAGEFVMGTSDDDIKKLLTLDATKGNVKELQEKGYFKREQPQHRVMLNEFGIAKYPVTNAEYQAFVQATGQRAPSHWSGNTLPEELAAHPVVNVSWDDAVAYCAWLTEQMRAAGQLREGEMIRLPTEAEWEKAASWDDANKAKRIWAWGDEWDASKCNTAEGGVGGTTPVGKYSPQGDSFYGEADMTGNVWEWCSSLYKPYPYKIDDGRENPEDRESRVLRGGSFINSAILARCAYRLRNVPDFRNDYNGFRCARSFSS